MGQRILPDPIKPDRMDIALVAVFGVLAGLGLATLLSASHFRAERLFGDGLFFVRRQMLWLALSAVGAAAAAFVPLQRLRRLSPLIIVLVLVLLAATLVPGVGAEFLGGRRWIIVGGVSLQPSEFAKPALVLYLAHILSSRSDWADPVGDLLPPFIVTVLVVGLIVLQNDFSTAIFVGLIALSLFFLSGAPLRFFIGTVLAAVPVLMILLLSREHRVRRVIAFLEPHRDPMGSGFQMLAARRALESGGLLGTGIGAGEAKLGLLPLPESDFIFAVVGEETGFLGVGLILLLFGLLGWLGLKVGMQQDPGFGRLLALGITLAVVLQAVLNMAVVAGLAPSTGIPLPLISAGGSSLLTTGIGAGLLINLARNRGTADE